MGARIMLRRNVCTTVTDGLVNGAMGTVVGFEWPEGHRTANTQPSGISVLFDSCKVGRMARNSTGRTPTMLVQSRLLSRAKMVACDLSGTSIQLLWHGL